jgi:hypothetical protein
MEVLEIGDRSERTLFAALFPRMSRDFGSVPGPSHYTYLCREPRKGNWGGSGVCPLLRGCLWAD